MNKKAAFFLPLLTFSLSSCFYIGGGFSGTISIKDTKYVDFNEPTYESSYKSSNLKLENVGFANGWKPLKSNGDINLLVVPIETKDDYFSQDEISLIKDGFFGESTSTGWESLKSYYNKSSHGKLNFQGQVLNPLKVSNSTSGLEYNYLNYTNSSEDFITAQFYNQTVEYICDSSNDAQDIDGNSIDLKKYDNDNDGYIDAIWFVYSPHYNRSDETLYWAWTGSARSTETFSQNGNTLRGNAYSWASIDFFKEGKYKSGNTYLADSHTFIHETGHLLGIDDYYSYDNDDEKNFDAPVGGVDMMDFNIGDHMAFTKFQLGWETPMNINDVYSQSNQTIELKSHTDYNESIIIPAQGYNKTPYDEYLILEYYTPTNLNKKDNTKYTNNLGTYTQSGLLIYHVDARVGKMNPNSKGEPVWDKCKYDKLPSLDFDTWNKYFMYTPIYNNTRSYCYESTLQKSDANFYRGMLVSLLPATGSKIKSSSGYSTNNSLCKNGFEFNSKYENFYFDDGNTLPFNFKVVSTDSSSCTIEFTKK